MILSRFLSDHHLYISSISADTLESRYAFNLNRDGNRFCCPVNFPTKNTLKNVSLPARSGKAFFYF